MRLYQIHRLRVEDTQHASSVTGRVQGMEIGGSAYISGHMDTLHISNLFANGSAYSLIQVTMKLPIRIGDDLLVVCRQGKNGVWQVLSVANRSTKTSYALSPLSGLVYHWIGFLGGLLSVIIIIGLILAPLTLFNALRFTQRDFAEMLVANSALSRIAKLPLDTEVDHAIKNFNESPPERLLRLLFG